jgi:nicotinate-nucleotide adenylyltransferase
LPPNHQPDKRRIGLLGGSFNPAHGGHREISLSARERLDLDAVWWLVAPANPLKDESDYAPYDERLHRARRIADGADIVVSDFESRHHLQYTVDTIERLKRDNPNVSFVWLMGADSLAGFHRWKDWRRIADLAPIAVFNRPGYGAGALESEAARALASFRIEESQAAGLAAKTPPAWVFISDLKNPLSSTALRNKAKKETPGA